MGRNVAFNRRELITLLQWLTVPQPAVYIKSLRKAYETFLTTSQPQDLLETIRTLHASTATPEPVKAPVSDASGERKHPVRREDLRLICFDYVWQ